MKLVCEVLATGKVVCKSKQVPSDYSVINWQLIKLCSNLK